MSTIAIVQLAENVIKNDLSPHYGYTFGYQCLYWYLLYHVGYYTPDEACASKHDVPRIAVGHSDGVCRRHGVDEFHTGAIDFIKFIIWL